MRTTIYQAFIPRRAIIFTLVEIAEQASRHATMEVLPSGEVAKMDEEELLQLIDELYTDENKKASWEI